MKSVFMYSVLLSLCYTTVTNAQDEKSLIEGLVKNNANQQQLLLSASKDIAAYENSMSENYQAHLEQMPDSNIPFNAVQEIATYANELPVVIRLELNVSYILDVNMSRK